MGGVLGFKCTHQDVIVVSDVKKYPNAKGSGLCWYYEAAEVQCSKCQTRFRATRDIGRFTGTDYFGWRIHDTWTCDHEDFTVDESTKKVQHNQTANTSGDECCSFWIAEADCNKCNLTLAVRCDFKTEPCNFGQDTENIKTSEWEKY